ncbi:hypothetical protein GVAV_000558 [Gurleya vavrai]
MNYGLHKKKFANTPKDIYISDFIIMFDQNEITITDLSFNHLFQNKYPFLILQTAIVSKNSKYYVVVLFETCKIEISEFYHSDYKYHLKLISLKYYEKGISTRRYILPGKCDIHNYAYINPNSFFRIMKETFFVKINDRQIAIFDLLSEKESWIVDISQLLNIHNFISFDVLIQYTMPTLAILLENKILIYSFENNNLFKIEEIAIDGLIFDVKGLNNGLCYIKCTNFITKEYEICIMPLNNFQMEKTINIQNFNKCFIHNDDIFIFSEDGLFRIEVIFMHNAIKNYRLDKIYDFRSEFGFVNDKFLFVGNFHNDCFLFEIEKEEENLDQNEIFSTKNDLLKKTEENNYQNSNINFFVENKTSDKILKNNQNLTSLNETKNVYEKKKIIVNDQEQLLTNKANNKIFDDIYCDLGDNSKRICKDKFEINTNLDDPYNLEDLNVKLLNHLSKEDNPYNLEDLNHDSVDEKCNILQDKNNFKKEINDNEKMNLHIKKPLDEKIFNFGNENVNISNKTENFNEIDSNISNLFNNEKDQTIIEVSNDFTNFKNNLSNESYNNNIFIYENNDKDNKEKSSESKIKEIKDFEKSCKSEDVNETHINNDTKTNNIENLSDNIIKNLNTDFLNVKLKKQMMKIIFY